MRKILTVLLLLVCGSGAFAQYMSSGVVSQGTLINNRTEIIRSGFDIWAGGGAGGSFTGVGGGSEGVFSSSFHADVNAGYNVAPRAFLGVGLRATYSTSTSVFALYANIRAFDSRNVNSAYFDFRLGKVLGGKTQKYIVENEWSGYDTYYHKPNRPKPENVLRLSELDVKLVQALSKHWVVTVEQQGNEVLLELYPYVDERNFNDHTNDSNDVRGLGSD